VIDRRLGKLPPRWDRRTLKMARFLTPALTPPPPAVYWSKGFPSWGMYLNDQLGDCTIAAIAHAIQTWKINLGHNVNLAKVSPLVQQFSRPMRTGAATLTVILQLTTAVWNSMC